MLLPDELMGSSSLLAHMNGVCISSGGSVVALKQVPREDGRCATASSTRARRSTPTASWPSRGWSRSPTRADAPSDLDHHRALRADPGRVRRDRSGSRRAAGGEIQLTDALRAQAARSPFHGVLSDVDRFDTGTPLGYLQAAVALSLRGAEFGADLATFLRGLPELTARRRPAAEPNGGRSSGPLVAVQDGSEPPAGQHCRDAER